MIRMTVGSLRSASSTSRGLTADFRIISDERISRRWMSLPILASVLLLISLCYKLTALGLIAFAMMAVSGLKFRQFFSTPRFPLIFALLYIADATITAFMVSPADGIVKTSQFLVIGAGFLGMSAYSWAIDEKLLVRGLLWISAVVSAVYCHMIIYHVSIGKIVTWKDLADTKFVISLSVFLLFSLRDEVEKKGYNFLFIAFIILTLVGLSSERKALLTFILLLASSNYSLMKKLYVVGAVASIGITIAVTGIDGGYLAQRANSTATNYSQMTDRYFATVPSIAARSDVIRTFVNRKATELFETHPIAGLGATGYSAWSHRRFGAKNGLAMNVHGEIHRVPVEGGIIGILIALGFLATTGYRAIRFAMRGERASLHYAPLYLLLYTIAFASVEAVNTALLVLVGFNGVVASRLPGSGASRALRLTHRRMSEPPKGTLREKNLAPMPKPEQSGSLMRRTRSL
jgi:hypothetical protein